MGKYQLTKQSNNFENNNKKQKKIKKQKRNTKTITIKQKNISNTHKKILKTKHKKNFKWSRQYKVKYLAFIKQYENYMELPFYQNQNQQKRNPLFHTGRIYRQMSKYLKDPSQQKCSDLHFKMIKKYKTLETIIKQYKKYQGIDIESQQFKKQQKIVRKLIKQRYELKSFQDRYFEKNKLPNLNYQIKEPQNSIFISPQDRSYIKIQLKQQQKSEQKYKFNPQNPIINLNNNQSQQIMNNCQIKNRKQHSLYYFKIPIKFQIDLVIKRNISKQKKTLINQEIYHPDNSDNSDNDQDEQSQYQQDNNSDCQQQSSSEQNNQIFQTQKDIPIHIKNKNKKSNSSNFNKNKIIKNDDSKQQQQENFIYLQQNLKKYFAYILYHKKLINVDYVCKYQLSKSNYIEMAQFIFNNPEFDSVCVNYHKKQILKFKTIEQILEHIRQKLNINSQQEQKLLNNLWLFLIQKRKKSIEQHKQIINKKYKMLKEYHKQKNYYKYHKQNQEIQCQQDQYFKQLPNQQQKPFLQTKPSILIDIYLNLNKKQQTQIQQYWLKEFYSKKKLLLQKQTKQSNIFQNNNKKKNSTNNKQQQINNQSYYQKKIQLQQQNYQKISVQQSQGQNNFNKIKSYQNEKQYQSIDQQQQQNFSIPIFEQKQQKYELKQQNYYQNSKIQFNMIHQVQFQINNQIVQANRHIFQNSSKYQDMYSLFQTKKSSNQQRNQMQSIQIKKRILLHEYSKINNQISNRYLNDFQYQNEQQNQQNKCQKKQKSSSGQNLQMIVKQKKENYEKENQSLNYRPEPYTVKIIKQIILQKQKKNIVGYSIINLNLKFYGQFKI